MEETSISAPSSQQYDVSRTALRPVTIRQVLSTEFEETFSSSSNDNRKHRYLIDGHEFESVTLVAMIRFVEPRDGSTTYVLEDGTGVLRGREWIERDEHGQRYEPENLSLRELAYVRIYGKPDKWKQFISVKIDHIRLVDDAHEVYFHLLESIVATLQYTRGPPVLGSPPSPPQEFQTTPVVPATIYESSSARAPVAHDAPASAKCIRIIRYSPPVLQPPAAERTSPPGSPTSSSTSEDGSLSRDDSEDSDQSPPTTGSPSGDSLYLSTSEHTDDGEHADEEELAELRRDLEAPLTPPQHTHHALCRCADKPDQLRPPWSSSSNYGVASPARPLRPDPYSQLPSLERNILLHIHARQSQDESGTDIASIRQAVKPFGVTGANATRVNEAINRLLEEGIIELSEQGYFTTTQLVHRLYPDL